MTLPLLQCCFAGGWSARTDGHGKLDPFKLEGNGEVLSCSRYQTGAKYLKPGEQITNLFTTCIAGPQDQLHDNSSRLHNTLRLAGGGDDDDNSPFLAAGAETNL